LHTGDAGRRAKPLRLLEGRSSEGDRALQRLLSRAGKRAAELGFLPLSARNQSMSVIVDKTSGRIEEIVPISPW